MAFASAFLSSRISQLRRPPRGVLEVGCPYSAWSVHIQGVRNCPVHTCMYRVGNEDGVSIWFGSLIGLISYAFHRLWQRASAELISSIVAITFCFLNIVRRLYLRDRQQIRDSNKQYSGLVPTQREIDKRCYQKRTNTRTTTSMASASALSKLNAGSDQDLEIKPPFAIGP